MQIKKAKVVIEYSDGAIIGSTVFGGKGATKEANDHFVKLVVEDLQSRAEADGKIFDEKDAKNEAKAAKGNYSREGDNFDIMIVTAN